MGGQNIPKSGAAGSPWNLTCSQFLQTTNFNLKIRHEGEFGKQICPLPWDICVRFSNSAALDNSRQTRGRVTHEEPV